MASIVEISIKSSLGTLMVDFNLKDLPFHHKDPFNRMLIAQSIQNGFPLVTDDEKTRLYRCSVV